MSRPRRHPVSPAQRRLWFLERMHPGEALYNITWLMDFEGPLRPAGVGWALARVGARHAVLRTTFSAQEGEPFQRVADRPATRLPLVDLSRLDLPARPREAERLAREDEERPFDLARGPLHRTTLLRLEPEEHRLQAVFHHTVADGWSLRTFAHEVEALYGARESGGDARLPPLPCQYGDYARRRWQDAEGPRASEDLEGWRGTLAGAPAVLDLPTDRPRPAVPGSRAGWQPLAVAPAVIDRLGAAARGAGGGLFAALFAAFFTLLHRTTGEEDLVVGFPARGRSGPGEEGLIGLFVRTLPLRVRVTPDLPFSELVSRIGEGVAQALSRADTPFHRIVEALRPERSRSHAPLFQVFFVLQNRPLRDARLPGGQVVRHRILEHSAAKFDLTFNLTPDPTGQGGIGGGIEYRLDLFDPSTAVRLARRFETLIAAAAADPAAAVGRLPLLPAAERHAVAVEWCRPLPRPDPAASAAAPEAPFPAAFARRVESQPDAVAVEGPDRTLTYAGLDRRVGELAARLAAGGVRPGDLVGVALSRSIDALVGLLAVQRAGAAYLPLDPGHPAGRLAFLVADAGVTVALTGGEGSTPPLPAQVVRVPVRGEAHGTAPAAVRPSPEDRAYAIYTSGSTGVPKAVVVGHDSLARFAASWSDAVRLHRETRTLQFASLGFDASVLEIFSTLWTGGTLCLGAPEELLPGEPLARFLAARRVSHFFLVPSVLATLPDDVPLPALEWVAVGGEASPPDLAERWLRRPGLRGGGIVNAYGPTEVTAVATTGALRPEPPGRGPSIGRPLPPARVRILDRELRPAAAGVPGELCVGGRGLAHGYLHRPDRTAERFVPDPHAAGPARAGARLYRTGDLARWLPDGRVDFLGRLDHQVKVRGLRIELGEVEARLAEHPALAAVAAVATGTGGSGDGAALVAYYVVRDRDPGPTELRRFLSERLPPAVVPSAFVRLDALPRTTSGKLDRKALPAPSPAAEPSPPRAAAAREPVEELLAGIWAQVLGLEPGRVAPDDDFFDLGGHSLLAARAIARVRATFGVEITLHALFEDSTLAALAGRIAELRRQGERDAPAAPALPPVDAREDPPEPGTAPVFPLSFAQERLWFLDRLFPGTALYTIPFRLDLHPPVRAAGLARALRSVVGRHEVLRTTYTERDHAPVQVVGPPPAPELPVVDLSGLPAARVGLEAERLGRAEGRRPFDLEAGPVLRARLLLLRGGAGRLVVVVHHVAFDGWSLDLFARELEALYRGDPDDLPALPVQYGDFAAWQRRHLTGAALEPQLAWWRSYLAGFPGELRLPYDQPAPRRPTFRAGSRAAFLSPALVQGVDALARDAGATPFMVLLAAFAALLGRLSDTADVALGSPVAGRHQTEIESLIGFFVHTLVLRVRLDGRPTFRQAVERTREAVLGAFAHEKVPFERLVEDLAPERDASRNPLIQVVFNLLVRSSGRAGAEPAGSGGEMTSRRIDSGSARFDLALTIEREGEHARAELDWSEDRFDRLTGRRLLEHFAHLLAAGLEAAETPLDALSLLGPPAAVQVLREDTSPAGAAAEPASLEQALVAQARRRPQAIAIVAGAEHLSYEELLRRVERGAARLRAHGVGPEVLVGVSMPRSAQLVVSILAVLRAGGAYLPLDSSYPADHLALMMDDAGVRLVVGDLPAAGPARPVRRLPSRELADGDATAVLPLLPAASEHLAYVIYTSGSTGRPKGVEVRRRGLSNLVAAQVEAFGLGPPARVLQFAPTSFDASVFELAMTLRAGATLVVPATAELLPGSGLGALVRRERITCLTLPPSVLAALPDRDLPDLTTLVSAGEALPGALAGRWQSGRRLYNAYGPTETTVWATVERCRGREAQPPIGRPVAGFRLAVLRPDLRAAPPGETGELGVAGAGLARGYRGRPGTTAERFVPDPFAAAATGGPGARLYRTGDLVRTLGDGRLEFLGRTDQQVKIRGHRVEPGEVESAIAAHPEVRAAAVVPRPGPDGQARLEAYVVAPGTSPAALREHLARRLPRHLLPSVVVPLERLPLLPTGKIDRGALPAPALTAGPRSGPAIPRSELETVLAGIWEELLGVSGPAPGDDFFELGGHSLLVGRLVSRVRKRLGVELPPAAVFQGRTLSAVARALEESAAPPLPEVERAPREGPLPLTLPQERIWFLGELSPRNIAYNSQVTIRFEGPLSPPLLQRVLSEVVRRHEALRSRYFAVDGQPWQEPVPARPVELPVIDLRSLPEDARRRSLEQAVLQEGRRPFQLDRPPLVRWRLLLEAPAVASLLQVEHHFVHDGWAFGVLLSEIRALYEAFAAGRPSPLPEPPIQIGDFALWQRRLASGDRLRAHLDYWRERLAEAPPVLELPADRSRPPVPSFRGDVIRTELPLPLGRELRRTSREAGWTLFAVMLAGFDVLLSRHCGVDEVVVGSGMANRRTEEAERMVGMVVNTLALRTDLGGDPTFRQLLTQVTETLLGAHAYQDVPLDRLIDELKLERDASRNPLVQVLFSFHDSPVPDLDVAGLLGSVTERHNRTAKTDLNVVVVPRGEQRIGQDPREGDEAITLIWEYSTDLFDRTTMLRMVSQYRRLLAAAVAELDRRVSALPLLGGAERAQLLSEWRGGPSPYPRYASLSELLAERTAAWRERAAVRAAGETLTYGALDRRANRLAHRLRDLGVRRGSLVALALERSAEALEALLAVVKAGGAYVPLDPSYPPERLGVMLRDAGAPLVLTREVHLSVLAEIEGSGRRRVVCLDSESERAALRQAPATAPEVATEGSDLAYVIYTSGSTGRPKGVAVPHRAVARLVLGTNYGRFGPDETFLHVASVSFDAATYEVWGALLHGAALAVLPPGPQAPDRLARLLVRERPTTGFLTVGLFNQLVEECPEGFESFRHLMAGGEAVSPEHVRRLLRIHPRLVLSNGYGPTENTTFSTHRPVREPSEVGTTVPIGRPVANTSAQVVDPRLRPLPAGVPGELLLGGDGLAWGYHDQPGLSAEWFVPDPLGAVLDGKPGGRLYRTGDLARWRPTGELEFLGRYDAQVKVRGFRIELGEIELALMSHPAVAEAAVSVHEAQGEKTLVAHVVPAAGKLAPERLFALLRPYLGDRLPHFMVPQAFVARERLPLTGSGKVDRRALRREGGELGGGAGAEGGFVPPRGPLEEMVAAVWGEVLHRDAIGAHDDFFALGGHSLAATRVVSRLRRAFGVEVPLRELFDEPTVARLAARIETLRRAEDGGAALLEGPIERRGRERGPAPLSLGQERLWLLDRFDGGGPAYNMPEGFRLRGPLQLEALDRAVREVLRRHEVLRSRFVEVDGELRQEPGAGPFHLLPVIDLRRLAPPLRNREIGRLSRAEAARAFDLARGPLLRARLVRSAAEEHALLLTVHHTASDGWSHDLLHREIGTLYSAAAAGDRPRLPLPPIQFADYAAWQRHRLESGALAPRVKTVVERLAGLEPLELPTDRPRPPVRGFRGALRRRALPGGLAGRLDHVRRREGATLFMTLLAAFETLLWRYTRQPRFAVGSPIANRERPETEGLIGFFVDMLVLPAELRGAEGFGALLGRVRQAAVQAFADQKDVPFGLLVQELQPDRDPSRTPVFQVAFQVLHHDLACPDLRGVEVERLEVPTGTAKFDLELTVVASASGLELRCNHSLELFEASTADRLLGHLEALLAAAAEDAERPVAALPLLVPAERHQLLVEAQGRPAEVPEPPLHRRIRRRIRERPDAVAVASGGAHWSYRELGRRAAAVAARLGALGVGDEAPVGLYLDRSPAMAAAMLGVLEAGGAFLPLDPGYPAERIAGMIEDSGTGVVLAERRLAASLPPAPGVRTLLLDELDSEVGETAPLDAEPRFGDDPRRLAYILYTSGSTGRPKGVACRHLGVSNLLADFDRRRPLGPGGRCAWWTSPSFDVSVYEVFSALLAGGTLQPVPDDVRPDAERLTEWLVRHRVESAYVPPFALPVLAEAGAAEGGLSLGRLLVGVEPVEEGVLASIQASTPGLRVINGYGPTEVTVCATLYDVPPRPAGSERTPIGRPVQNGRALLLDPLAGAHGHLQPVPGSVAGEVFLGGPGLARGYHRRPAHTARAFVPDPYPERPGARLYRTGDFARRLPRGDLLFVGRLDQQVKVRGMRVELGEVESVLSRHEGVRRVVARVIRAPAGDRRLVAYAVPAAESRVDAEELRELARRYLPAPMVPSAIELLEELPQTPSGKVDARALPEPAWEAAGAGEDGTGGAPRTETERIVAAVWSTLLGVERPGRQDDFFDLGGHSLLATRVTARLRAAAGVDLPIRTVFQRSVLADLAAEVEAARAGAGPQAPPIRPAPRDRDLPLSFSQLRQWFLVQLEPDSPAYNLPLTLRLAGELSRPALARALEAVVRRHEVLRTAFLTVAGRPRQVVEPAPAIPLPVVDLRHLPGTERRLALETAVALAGERPFDLARPPLLRPVLFDVGTSGGPEHVLLTTVHHIAFDGWSFAVFTRELAESYRAFADGRSPELPELPIQYADYAHWQRTELAGPILDAQRDYWRSYLAGAPRRLELPTDRPRPANLSPRGGSEYLDLSPELAGGLRRLGADAGATPFMVLLASFQALLGRLAGQDDLTVGTFLANRRWPEVEGLVGFFVNTLVLRGDLRGTPSFPELLDRVREATLAAYDHQDLPFEHLLEALEVERDLSRAPLFQVMCGMLNFASADLRLDELEIRPDQLYTGGRTNSDLALWGWEETGGIRLWLQYRTQLFDRTTAARLLRQLRTLSEAVTAAPAAPVREAPLLAAGERHQVLHEWNPAPPPAPPASGTVLDLLSLHAETRPDAAALTAGSTALTYGELRTRALRLASRLAAAGLAGPETVLAVRLDRSPELVVAILGVLHAGAAYLPVDPAAPPERTRQVLSNARAAALLERPGRGAADAVSGLGLRLLDDAGARRTGRPDDGSKPPGVPPEALAYVIYTSGSTGEPKGVAVGHSCLRAFVEAAVPRYGLGPDDRVLQFASPAFDASVEEVFGALAAGATLVLRDDEALASPARFFAACERHRVTVADLPTAWWHELAGHLAAGGRPAESLRLVVIGGEAAVPRAVAEWLAAAPRPRLVNTYGPTEATVVSTVVELDASPEAGRAVPIGFPLGRTRAYVSDPRLRTVPANVAGELLLGGPGVARGYVGRPAATARSFVPDPWSETPGARLYRSGDLARRPAAGGLEFAGRIDRQVKIRGYRVEPDGVAAAVSALPEVGEATVVASEEASGRLRLVAYVVPRDGSTPAAARLREALRATLPEYSIPAEFIALDSLPLTDTGKVDRRALPEPGTGERAARDHVPPGTVTEEVLAEIWGELLGVERVGVEDDFFDLGGHSLLAPQLIARIEAELGVALPLGALFEAPTLGQLAATVEEVLIDEIESLSDEEAERLLAGDEAPAAL